MNGKCAVTVDGNMDEYNMGEIAESDCSQTTRVEQNIACVVLGSLVDVVENARP